MLAQARLAENLLASHDRRVMHTIRGLAAAGQCLACSGIVLGVWWVLTSPSQSLAQAEQSSRCSVVRCVLRTGCVL